MKLYHSIHARGERIEDVLKKFEKEEADAEAGIGEVVKNNDSVDASGGEQTNGAPAEDLEEGEVELETEDQLPASHVSLSFLIGEEMSSIVDQPSSSHCPDYVARPAFARKSCRRKERHGSTKSCLRYASKGVFKWSGFRARFQ